MQPTVRALYRWSGRAIVDGSDRDWSLILKASRRVDTADDPTHWNYWKREYLAYTSDVLDDLPGIAAPRLLGAGERGEVALLWLEDVPEAEPGRWPTERYARAAHDLGAFNGAYLAGRALPSLAFLTRTYLRSWTAWLPWTSFAQSSATWSDPNVTRAFPDPPMERLRQLEAAASGLFDRLERLPQTLSHLDAWRSNLIGARHADGRDRTVAVDWSLVGTAPAGQEVAILVAGSHIWLDADPDELATLSQRALAAYIDGMRGGGWRGDVRSVRFAYAASAALYAAPLIPLWLSRVADPARREWLERKCGRPLEEIVRGWALLLDFLLGLADEAYALAGI